MPKIYRVMASEEGTPKIGNGSCMLGARNKDLEREINIDASIPVKPSDGGISVGGCMKTLYVPMLPRRLQYVDPGRFRGAKGKDSHKVWAMGEGPYEDGIVASELELYLAPNDKPGHGLVRPSREMSLETYQSALAATQSEWQIDEKHDDECTICKRYGIS